MPNGAFNFTASGTTAPAIFDAERASDATAPAAFAAAGDSGGWVSGELNGKQGSFPSNYCAPK